MGGYKRFALTAALSFLILCAAEGLRLFAESVLGPFANAVCELVTVFCFFGLLAAWAVSVRRRVMRDDLRRLLLTAAGVILFWLLVRFARYQYAFAPYALDRLLWYAYYVPIIALPLLGFFVSFRVGRPEGEKLRLPLYGLIAVAAALAGLVLTNDLHGLVFCEVGQTPSFAVYAGKEETYAYGVGFFAVALWVLALELTSVLLVIRKGAGRLSGPKRFLPLAVFLLAVVYWIGYWKAPTYGGVGFVELTVGLSWFSVMIWESCICTGLIPVNTRYTDFFHASSLRLQITDFNGVPYLASPGAEPLDGETFSALKQARTLVCNEDTQLHIYPIDCGYSVWQEDIGALTDMIAELKLNAEELREGNALEARQYAARRKREKIREKNRLYSVISGSLEPDFAGIRVLLDRLDAETDAAARRQLLARINLAGVFLKRRGNAVMIAEGGERITDEELGFCLAELAENMKLCDLKMTYSVVLPAGLPLEEAFWFYGTLQTATAGLIGFCGSVFALLAAHDGDLRFSLTAYADGADFEKLCAAAKKLAADCAYRIEEDPAEKCVCVFADRNGEVRLDDR